MFGLLLGYSALLFDKHPVYYYPHPMRERIRNGRKQKQNDQLLLFSVNMHRNHFQIIHTAYVIDIFALVLLRVRLHTGQLLT